MLFRGVFHEHSHGLKLKQFRKKVRQQLKKCKVEIDCNEPPQCVRCRTLRTKPESSTYPPPSLLWAVCPGSSICAHQRLHLYRFLYCTAPSWMGILVTWFHATTDIDWKSSRTFDKGPGSHRPTRPTGPLPIFFEPLKILSIFNAVDVNIACIEEGIVVREIWWFAGKYCRSSSSAFLRVLRLLGLLQRRVRRSVSSWRRFSRWATCWWSTPRRRLWSFRFRSNGKTSWTTLLSCTRQKGKGFTWFDRLISSLIY